MLNGLYMKLILKTYLDTLKWVVIKQLAAVGNMKKVGNKKKKICLGPWKCPKKQKLGQYQAMLTSDLVSNVYMLFKGIIWKHRWYHCGVP